MESLNSNSQERELYQLQQMQHKAKESCMKSFRLLQSHLQVLSYNDLKINGCFERAFATLFEQDVHTFIGIMLLNLDQLEKKLDKDEFQGDRFMVAFCVINKQFQMFINSQFTWDYDSQMTEKYFVEYTGIEVKQFRETLLLHMGTSKWPVPFVRYNWTAQLMSLLMKLNGIMSNLNHICHISVGKDAPEFCEFFEINDLKAQLQAKTTLICNLKNQIKSVKEASNEAKNEKLNKENEHLKQTFKELYDSIKKTQIQTRDHNDSLIAQVNSKTVENGDLKAQIQEKDSQENRLALQRHMAYADNTSGPAAQRKKDVVQEPVVSTGTPSSTRIDQDTLYKNLVLEDSLPVQDVLSRSSDAFSLAVDLKVKLITRRGSEKQQANQGATGKMEWLSFTSWYRISA
ncbi:hypothetical protein Tco_0212926 [Tanacetum coccineum]